MDILDRIYGSFFDGILRGESKTYNDHNWYTSGGLRGYIEGSGQKTYSLFKKPLSEYTIGEIMQFQSRPRDATGQLWATGRYQIISNTLKGLVEKAGLKASDKYSIANQNILGGQLLKNRSSIWNYINGTLPDTTENVQKASLEMAKIWSSLGVPYGVEGRSRFVNKDESYYSGGGDKASVSSDVVISKLRELRSGLVGKVSGAFVGAVGVANERPILTMMMSMAFVLASYVLFKTLKK